MTNLSPNICSFKKIRPTDSGLPRIRHLRGGGPRQSSISHLIYPQNRDIDPLILTPRYQPYSSHPPSGHGIMVVSQETVAQYSGSLDPLPESKDPATADFIHSTLWGHPRAGSNPEDKLCGQCVLMRRLYRRHENLATGVNVASNIFGKGKK